MRGPASKFVLVSALLFLFWTPLSRAYLAFLSFEANAVFGLIHHPARLEADRGSASILYPNVFPPHPLKKDIRIPILQGIAIYFNLIVLIALFAVTPGMPRGKKIRGIAIGGLVLSLLHVFHVYLLSYLFIWDYVDGRRWPFEISAGDVQQLRENVESGFPRSFQPYVSGVLTYWNHFIREGAALLIYLYFAYPSLQGFWQEAQGRSKGR